MLYVLQRFTIKFRNLFIRLLASSRHPFDNGQRKKLRDEWFRKLLSPADHYTDYSVVTTFRYLLCERFPRLDKRLNRGRRYTFTNKEVLKFKNILHDRYSYITNYRKDTGRSPWFDFVSIETFNRCNGTCAFCPVNKNINPRPRTKMPEKLFQSIIAQLVAISFSGTLTLCIGNEPLLDTRFNLFLQHARHKLHKAKIVLHTNGTLLTLERYKKIITNLDHLYINNYCLDLKLKPNIQHVWDSIQKNREWLEKTYLSMRYEKEKLFNRASKSPDQQDYSKPIIPFGCTAQSLSLNIGADGNVALCCADTSEISSFGNVNNSTLEEIWFNKEYEDTRLKI